MAQIPRRSSSALSRLADVSVTMIYMVIILRFILYLILDYHIVRRLSRNMRDFSIFSQD